MSASGPSGPLVLFSESAFLKLMDNILYFIGKLKVLGFEFQSSGFWGFSHFYLCNFDKTLQGLTGRNILRLLRINN